MLVRELKDILADLNMQNKKLNVKLIGEHGDRVTNKDLLKAINALSIRIDQVEARIDNLENLVVTQFKEHGWIK